MRKFFGPMGSVSRVTIESKVLKSNMLGDPPVRVVDVYIPAGHDGQGLPLLVNLVGFTSSGLSQTKWAGFRENLPERLDRLVGEHRVPPVVVGYLRPPNVRTAIFAAPDLDCNRLEPLALGTNLPFTARY